MPTQIMFVDNYSEEARPAFLYLPGEPVDPSSCALDPDEQECGSLNEFDLSMGRHDGWVACDNGQYTEWMHLRCIVEAAESGAECGLLIGHYEITARGKHLKAS